MNIKPIGDKVLIQATAAETESKGGVFLPDTVKNTNLEGTVISVGPGRRLVNGTLVPMEITVGSKVYYAPFSGSEVTIDGKKLIILAEKDILAVAE